MPSSLGIEDHDNTPTHQPSPTMVNAYLLAAAISFLFFVWVGFQEHFGPDDWLISGFEGYFLLLIFVPMVFVRGTWAQPENGDGPPTKDRVLFGIAFVVVLTVALASPGFSGSYSILLNAGESGDYPGIEFSLPIALAALAIGVSALVRNRDRALAVTAIVVLCVIFGLYANYHEMPLQLKGYVSLGELTYRTLFVSAPQVLFGSVVALIFLSITLEKTELGNLFISSFKSLFGTLRAGAAKAALLLVVLLGILTGDPELVFLWTCAITIPAMRMGGLSRPGAAAIQVTACSGALIMPLVVGKGAYIAAEFLDITYTEVLVSGALMAMAWVLSILLGIDGAAARSRNADENIRELTFRGRSIGRWGGVAVVVLGIVVLLYCAAKPVLAILLAFLLLIADRRIVGGADFLPTLKTATVLAVERVISAAPMFFVVGLFWYAVGFLFMPLIGNEQISRFTFELIDAPATIKGLFISASAYLFGWGFTSSGGTLTILMTSIFSGFVGAMALIAHFLSVGVFFAFPFAAGTIAAAAISGASPLSVFAHAIKLGTVVLVFPVFAVINHDLTPRQFGPDVIPIGFAVLAAVFCWSVGAYGYLFGLGDLRRNGRMEWPIRLLFIVAALVLPLTGSNVFGWPYAELPIGAGCALLALLLASNTGEATAPPET